MRDFIAEIFKTVGDFKFQEYRLINSSLLFEGTFVLKKMGIKFSFIKAEVFLNDAVEYFIFSQDFY